MDLVVVATRGAYGQRYPDTIDSPRCCPCRSGDHCLPPTGCTRSPKQPHASQGPMRVKMIEWYLIHPLFKAASRPPPRLRPVDPSPSPLPPCRFLYQLRCPTWHAPPSLQMKKVRTTARLSICCGRRAMGCVCKPANTL
jgi:hypothetical protein